MRFFNQYERGFIMRNKPWQIVLSPTPNGEGYMLDMMADHRSETKVQTLVELISEVLGDYQFETA
jgi:hypothetical protein